MPGQTDINRQQTAPVRTVKNGPHLSRRSILRGAAGAGAAGIAAAALGYRDAAFAATSGPAHDTKDRVTDTDTRIRSSCTYGTRGRERSTCSAAPARPACVTPQLAPAWCARAGDAVPASVIRCTDLKGN